MNKPLFAPYRKLLSQALVLSLTMLASLAGNPVRAQNSSELAATYGRGVHAYFANQTEEADRLFSQAIEAGSSDPRVFYFRAMARMSCGRQYEAEDDMRTGAAFEARDPGNRLSVSKALERVQGANRRTLESYRLQARVDRLQERQSQTRNRYERLERREPEVLRREAPVPLESLVEPSLDAPVSAAPSSAAPAPTPQPTQPALPPAPKPAPPSSSADDIFGAPSPAASEPESSRQPAESAEPADDAFGDPQPAKEPEQPSEESGPPQDEADEDNPFASTNPATHNSATNHQLAESDRVDSRKLAGVLGRVVASVFPWRGVELPSVGVPGPAESPTPESEPAAIALGPVEHDDAVTPASAEESANADSESTNIFGESEESAADQPADDPFETPADDAGAASEASEDGDSKSTDDGSEQPEKPAAASDDPFGEF